MGTAENKTKGIIKRFIKCETYQNKVWMLKFYTDVRGEDTHTGKRLFKYP